MQTEELLYYSGRQMKNYTVDNLDPLAVATKLSLEGYCKCVLEPGDATRYTLYLIKPEQDALSLMVTRDSGGDLASSWVHPYDEYSIRKLTNENEWTLKFFSWYLAQVFDALGA